jgi:hypothetical protein
MGPVQQIEMVSILIDQQKIRRTARNAECVVIVFIHDTEGFESRSSQRDNQLGVNV